MDQGKKKSRNSNGMTESSTSGISRYFNKSRLQMTSLSSTMSMKRKNSDITTDVERDTTNIPEESKAEEQKILKRGKHIWKVKNRSI